MTVEEAIVSLKQKINRNLTNGNVDIDNARAIMLLNDSMLSVVDTVLEQGRSTDYISRLSPLLVSKTISKYKKESSSRYVFDINEKVVRIENGYALIANGNCQTQATLYEIKAKERNASNQDYTKRVDLEFEVAPFVYAEKAIKIDSDHKVNKVVIDFYREPKAIGMKGVIMPDGKESTNQGFEFDDIIIKMIIDTAKNEYLNNNKNN